MGATQASVEAMRLERSGPGMRTAFQVLPVLLPLVDTTRLSWLHSLLAPSQAKAKRFQYFWGKRREV